LPLSWIITATLVTTAFFVFVLGKGIAAQRHRAVTGREGMIGQVARAQSRIDSAGGKVFIEGELWNAVSETPVDAGQPVAVTALTGLTLKVKPAP
jgi:membrane-bound serine protease (ClpP class)